jgi:IS605 OrfB family transposase
MEQPQQKRRGRPPGSKNKKIKEEKKVKDTSVKKTKNSSPRKRHVRDITSVQEHSQTGSVEEKSDSQGHLEDINDTFIEEMFPLQVLQLQPEDTSATLVYRQMHKNKIWKDKLSTSEIDILNTKLLQTLDQVSTSNEKDLTPFWNQQSKEISKKLWLPTEIDCVDSVLSSSKTSSLSTPMGRSWFSIDKKHHLNKNLLMTLFQSSQFSHPESMDLEVTKSKKKLQKQQATKTIIKKISRNTVLNAIKQATINIANQLLNKTPKKKVDRTRKNKDETLKTMKFRMFPTQEEKEKLMLSLEQSRWYYNATVGIMYKHFGDEKITNKSKTSFFDTRDLVRKYDFGEEIDDGQTRKVFTYNKEKNSFPVPQWWEKTKPHNKLITGSIKKFSQNLNSALSNYKNGNIDSFKMGFIQHKKNEQWISYETEDYPVFIDSIKTRYWYRTRNHKRKYISYLDVMKKTKGRGIELTYDKTKDYFTLHFPVSSDWFPEDDNRVEKQERLLFKGDRVIALDPGVRKFMVGYDPKGEMIFVGEDANKELLCLMKHLDTVTNRKDRIILWQKIKNLVRELHWKTISFLIENYDLIILPEFPVQKMIKGKKIRRSTKRCMMMFSFYSFKQKLIWKASLYNKRVMIVDESYTSKTCGNCGKINDVQGSETYRCRDCFITMDRDCNGARNIFIKNTCIN